MPSNTHTVIGGTKRFECRVIGHPRPEIRWFKDGRDITDNDRYSFDHTYEGVISMIMENIGHNDQGNYRCRAENSEGFASTSAYLLVKGNASGRKAHKEHPDEEIEEVHAMELEEHFVYKPKKDNSIITEYLREDKMDVDAVRKRTFEQAVDDEKENSQEVLNGTVSKESSGKKLSMSVEEQSYSKSAVNGYEETKKSSSKKTKSTSEESLSAVELGAVSEQEQTLQLESSESKYSASRVEKISKSSVSSTSEKELVSSSSKKTEESILSVSASVEETQVKSKTKSKESAMIVGVETEESASFRSKKESKSSLTTSVETEESEAKSKGLSLSIETSEAETSSKSTKQAAKSLIASVETEEGKQEADKAVLSAEATSETTRKEATDGGELTAEVKVEEVPEECRMEPQGVEDGAGDIPQDMTDSAPTSLCNDSGFMESSMLESSLLQADESMLESAKEESPVRTATPEITADKAKVSAEKSTEAKAKTLKEESHVEEIVVSDASETSELRSGVQEPEIPDVKESKESVTATTKVAQEKEASYVKEVTEETSADAVAATTTTAEQARVEEREETIKMEKTSVSQDLSRADETTELTSAGDITGLLDEKPDPMTVVEEEVVAVAEDQQEQRARWVDQITTRAETLIIEGEGKKVDELKAKDESASATEKHEDKPELSTASTEVSESSVDAESLVARQPSVVGDLPEVQAEVAVSTQESSEKQTEGHQERLEVDEGLSAQNVLGLQRMPTPIFEDVESSVDSVKPVGKETAAAAKEEDLTVKAEVDTEETKKAGKTEDEQKLSAEASVSEGEGVSAPRIVSVPDDVSVMLGQAIRLVSQVQGNPQPEVKWFKEGDTVKAGERITLQTEDDIFTLEINDANPDDGGTYTLTAHNSEGTIFSDVLVTVSIPPSIGPTDEEIRVTARLTIPEFVVQPGNVTVKELGALELVCTIKANPSPTVVWNKDGKTLKSDSHVSIFESGGQYYLEIRRATAEDAGEYTCTASNSEGSVSCSIAVFVESQETTTSATEEGAAAMVPLSQRESSSDVSTASVESATTRYLKLVAAAAAFSLAAFGVKKVVESLPK